MPEHLENGEKLLIRSIDMVDWDIFSHVNSTVVSIDINIFFVICSIINSHFLWWVENNAAICDTDVEFLSRVSISLELQWHGKPCTTINGSKGGYTIYGCSKMYHKSQRRTCSCFIIRVDVGVLIVLQFAFVFYFV